jgi:hypothetical protein
VWDGAKGSYVFTPRWDSRTVPDGSHELKVFIYDAMLNEASSKVTVTVNNGSLWTALRSLSAGTPVRMGAVTATTSSTDIPGKFYVEQPDRRAGICVVAAGAPSFAEGSSLAISGSIASLSTGERVISADGVSVIGPAQKIKPFAMGNRALGGTASGSAPGPHGGTGPHNVGLLVTTWGKVIHSETGLFYVDDGSGLQDG